MLIYLVRHGTTEWNKTARIQGRTDIPLDDIGISMASQTSENLKRQGVVFTKAFTSPLQRALKTAEILAPDLVPVPDPRLTELSFGRFEGRNTREMREDPSCAFRFFKDDPAEYNREVSDLQISDPEGGFETLEQLCDRASEFMRDVTEPLASQLPSSANVLISGHGALCKAVRMHTDGCSDLHLFWGNGLAANCGISVIECSPAGGSVVYKVLEDCITFYDPELARKTGALL